ncbi:MAG: response regulator transcription factor [Taibaiella sp.]|jgi:DNA-binding NarL/FixJ family response regulator
MSEKHSSIILVDDHAVVRNGLKELIELMGPYKVVGEFSNGRELIHETTLISDADLIIMDINMPEMDGAMTVEHIYENGLHCPVLVLTLNTDEDAIIKMYHKGVRGYLEKSCSANALRLAINDIITTGYHNNDLLSKAMYAHRKANSEDSQDSIIKKMTAREIEFLSLVCNESEYTYDQIADKMKVSRRTVDGYRESLFDKFQIKSKTGLVLFAMKYKLVK